jgi:uncharacterized protein (UPF0332 family)
MVNIRWCCKKLEGIRLIEPNDNLALSYIKMAEDALGTMGREKNFNMIFAISACYYSMYYSLYSILMKLGIKCEIHACTLEFMKVFLSDFYSEKEIEVINRAFDLRGISQYYADKIVDKKDIEFIMINAPYFLNKSKEVINKINENDIKRVRNLINNVRQNLKKENQS